MTNGLVSMFSLLSANFFAKERDLAPNETTLNCGQANYRVYRNRDNQYMPLGALEEKSGVIFEAIGRPDLIGRQQGDGKVQGQYFPLHC